MLKEKETNFKVKLQKCQDIVIIKSYNAVHA